MQHDARHMPPSSVSNNYHHDRGQFSFENGTILTCVDEELTGMRPQHVLLVGFMRLPQMLCASSPAPMMKFSLLPQQCICHRQRWQRQSGKEEYLKVYLIQ